MSSYKEKVFWVTNFSKKNVTLSDLYISIPAGCSVNLLDKRHYNFTEKQLFDSKINGSIFKKSHLISVRKVPPQMIPKYQIEKNPNVILPTRTKSIYEIKQEEYEELKISEDYDEDILKIDVKKGT